MKKFDFKLSIEMGHNETKTKWLKENHTKPIAETVFVETMKTLRKFSNCKTPRKKQHAYTPSKLKKEYKHLKRVYGFFNPTTK